MTRNIPKISVIMGVYNCSKTLEDSINSLLGQTFQDFEIILCDDGSTDNTFEIANKFFEMYSDKIVLLRNIINMGLNFTLNKCISFARGSYIARMDGDDLSLPKRFETQYAYLVSRPDLAFVCSAMIFFDESGDWGFSKPILKPTKVDFVKGTPFAHATSMIKREVLESVQGYTVSKKLVRVEDFHLWIKIYLNGYLGENLNEPLYRVRDNIDAMKRRNLSSRINESRVIAHAIKVFELPIYNYIYTIVPIVKFFVPRFIYKHFHRKLKNR